MCEELEAKDRRRMAAKHNRRSYLDYTAQGLYGPKCVICPSADPPLAERDGDGEEEGHEVDFEGNYSCELHLKWLNPPCTLLLIKKIFDDDATRRFKEFTSWIVQEKALSVVVEPAIFQELQVTEDLTYRPVLSKLATWKEEHSQEVLKTVDLIVCIGGDGTLLYTATLFPERIPPIIGFHMGSLGFLTPFQLDSFKSSIDRVLRGEASVTLRYRLGCTIRSPPPHLFSPNGDVQEVGATRSSPSKPKGYNRLLIVNEVVIDRGTSPYLTNLEVSCNERLITTVQGDGLIVATPTGSTAYSLAAGASMVHPSVPCMIITPICPHSLSFRPIVVPAGVEILIRVASESRSSAWVAADGRNRQEIKQGDSVVITNSCWAIPTINNTGHVTDWFDSLAVCLNWNSRKTQNQLKS
ncbi:hypothetical protein EMCRGX_G017354 [Ephydatia muelleri]